LKIQVMSDIHAEFHRDGGASFVSSLDPTDVDVLVVAGDLATESGLYRAVDALRSLYPQVVYVTGNHEYYSSDRGRVHRVLSKAQGRFDNFHWLHETTTTIQGQRFVGTTLWFQRETPTGPYDRPGMHDHLLNDFNLIRGFRKWVYKANQEALWFLDHEVGPEDIVVTHHVPSLEAVKPRWRGSPLTKFFVCHLHRLILEKKPKAWIFGHTHDSFDFHVGSTRLLCNPFGYVGHDLNPDYQDKLILEVGGVQSDEMGD